MNIWPVTGSIPCVTGQNLTTEYYKIAYLRSITAGILVHVMILQSCLIQKHLKSMKTSI